MKKFIIMMAAVLSMSVMFQGIASAANSQSEQKDGSAVVNAIGSLYSDGKAVVDTLYQDSKSVVSTIYDDGKNLLTNIYPDVKAAVVEIAKAVGVGAEYLFKVLILKYVVIGAKWLLIFIIGLIFTIYGFRNLRQYFRPKEPADITYRIIFPVVMLVAGIVMLLCVNYTEMLMGIINPGYGAVNYILEFTKSMI